jgi:hypothetical protein
VCRIVRSASPGATLYERLPILSLRYRAGPGRDPSGVFSSSPGKIEVEGGWNCRGWLLRIEGERPDPNPGIVDVKRRLASGHEPEPLFAAEHAVEDIIGEGLVDGDLELDLG